MITALLVTLAPALPSAPDDCAECRRGRTCRPHLAADRAGLKELAPKLGSKDPEVRIAALRSVAALTDEHANAPSKDVAEVLRDALEDDRLAVRAEAIGLLCGGQHPDTAVVAAVDLVEDFESRMRSLVGDLTGPKERHGTVMEAMDFVEATMRSARRLRDDRVVDALASILRAYPFEMRGEPIAQTTVASLLDLGTRDAVAAVIDQLDARIDQNRKRAIHLALVRFARDLEIEETPSFADDVDADWKRWAKKHARRIPRKLGRWEGPPPEEDDGAGDGDDAELVP